MEKAVKCYRKSCDSAEKAVEKKNVMEKSVEKKMLRKNLNGGSFQYSYVNIPIEEKRCQGKTCEKKTRYFVYYIKLALKKS
jgi:hypothetical protein